MIKNQNFQNNEWYANPGAESSIVLSTRVRLVRNLADFPFPSKYRNDDALRVKNLIFDGFLKSDDADSFQTMGVASFDYISSQVLIERSLIEKSTLQSPGGGIIMRIKGQEAYSGFVCTINDKDHLRISCFSSGFNLEFPFSVCKKTDLLLQESLQFAWTKECGYLASSINDIGSGMKLSARLVLPSTVFLGKMDELKSEINTKKYSLVPAFPESVSRNIFQFSSTFCAEDSEIEQLASFEGCVRTLIEHEKKNTIIVKEKYLTKAKDFILKYFGTVKFSLLLDFDISLAVISALKWGKNLGIITGISDEDIASLIFRLQEFHLRMSIKNQNFVFPEDIKDDEKEKAAFIRSIILQETVEKISFTI